jgi:hypothetical protein
VQKRARGLRATSLPRPGDRMHKWTPNIHTVMQDQARPGDRMHKWTPNIHTVMQDQADDAYFGGNTDAGEHQHALSVKCSQPLARKKKRKKKIGAVNVRIYLDPKSRRVSVVRPSL